MGKFKVGDRVIANEGNGWVPAGTTGTVTEDDDVPYVDWDTGKTWAVSEDYMSPTFTLTTGKHYRTRSGKVTGRVTRGDIGFDATVDAHVKVFDHAGGAVFGGCDDLVEEWVPKVGDRVVLTADNGSRGEWGAKGDVGRVELTTGSGCHVRFETGSQTGDWWAVYNDDLKPATLTIEAGRYYTTRDGRKVGPMVVAQGRGEPWPWKLESGTHYYKEDGFSCPGYAHGHDDKDDLIALWPDPTTTASAAPVSVQVDAIADEYGSGVVAGVAASNDNEPKFKVGDVVADGSALGRDKATVIGTERGRIQIEWHGCGSTGDWPADDFELVTPASSSDLSITIDTSQTEAALDTIIKKLKKIRRLSAELGIDLAA